MRAGKFGDLTRFPVNGLAFHIDCIAPLQQPKTFLEKIGRLIGDQNRLVVPEARYWSTQAMRAFDYYIHVIVLKRWQPWAAKHAIVDHWSIDDYTELLESSGFYFSRVEVLKDDEALRTWMTDRVDVEAYYDVDPERVSRTGVRSKLFTSWQKIGH